MKAWVIFDPSLYFMHLFIFSFISMHCFIIKKKNFFKKNMRVARWAWKLDGVKGQFVQLGQHLEKFPCFPKSLFCGDLKARGANFRAFLSLASPLGSGFSLSNPGRGHPLWLPRLQLGWITTFYRYLPFRSPWLTWPRLKLQTTRSVELLQTESPFSVDVSPCWLCSLRWWSLAKLVSKHWDNFLKSPMYWVGEKNLRLLLFSFKLDC